jgi:phage tail protein X
MGDYYDLVQQAGDSLAAKGFDAVSRELLEAERAAATAGEAIAGIGMVLRQALTLDLPDGTRRAVLAALDEGERLWNESNG